MADLPEAVKEAMRNKARTVRDRMAGSGGFKSFSLTGKNAIVQPGRELTLRLLPRWDIKQKYKLVAGKWQTDPNYQGGPIFVEAFEHWWDGADGKANRVWCPKTQDQDAACPVCEAAEDLKASPDEEDRKHGKRIEAKEVFLFNAVLGGTGKRVMNDQGRPDIRILSAPGTVYVGITALILGGEDESFARGDITHPIEGYDIKLSRPSTGGERWKVDAAAKSTPLVSENEKAAFAGPPSWMELLIDIPALLEKDVKAYETLYEEFNGVKAAPTSGAEPEPGADAGAESDPFAAGPGEETPTSEAAGEEAGEQPGDPFAGATPFDPPTAGAGAKAAGKPAAPPQRRAPAPAPKAPARRTPPPRGRR